MGNEIITLKGIDCYEDEGTVYLRLGNVARGLGITHKQKISGKEYDSVRWDRLNQYLGDIGFCPEVGKNISEDTFIPENVFYRLAMKAKKRSSREVSGSCSG